MNRKYKTIDLCAGIGGIRRGFEMTGAFANVLSAEIDPAAARTYEHLFGENPTNDVTSESFKLAVDSIEYDVLLAGFPCQAFSKIGKQEGFRDATRGTIFFEIADILSRTNPRAIFLENVENLLFHDSGNTIERIIKTLEEDLGYAVIGVTIDDDGRFVYDRSSFVRNTKDFGLPQNRPRTYIMGFSRKQYGKAVKRLTNPLPGGGDEIIYRNVDDLLEEVVDDKYYLSQGYLDTLKNHRARNRSRGNGFGYCVVNRPGTELHLAHTILAIGGSGKERNLVYQPKEGIAGKMISGKKSGLNSEGIRMMTPREWARLQGFEGFAFLEADGSDQFGFPDGTTDSEKYKQLGNSVSVPVIKAMADFMLDCFRQLEMTEADMVSEFVSMKGICTKRSVMELLDLNASQAGALLKKMVDTGELLKVSGGRATRYVSGRGNAEIPPIGRKEHILKLAETEGTISNGAVAKELGVSSAYAGALLSALSKEGTLMRLSRGLYGIPTAITNCI